MEGIHLSRQSGSDGDGGMRARPTMVDVAAVARVSLKTVSRVVNGEPGVHAKTAARVREAISVLGYRANDTARNLRRRQGPATVGLVIEDVHFSDFAGLLAQLGIG